MCGIVGYAREPAPIDLSGALHAMRHRGPDARAVFDEPVGERHVGFGHLRLSIVDLSSDANQPFFSADRQHVLIYNGEIYNHPQLRGRLQAEGWQFRTRSDTEVLLAGLARWGTHFIAELDGIFAFAWYDRSAGRVTLARDRVGIKPLYYQRDQRHGSLRFASEIRGLAALPGPPLKPDPACFAEFLLNGFLYEPASGVAGVGKLAPGHVAEFDLKSGAFDMRPYAEPAGPHEDASTRDFPAVLEQSTRSQMIADVKLGLSFSGGIDSSVLAAAATGDLAGLFVSFAADRSAGDAGDEAYAHEVARHLGLPLDEAPLAGGDSSNDAFLADVAHVARGTEEPISNYTYVASEFIARMARERGYKVLLSGMGGDELFAGYPRHRLVRHYSRLRRLSALVRLGSPVLRRVPALAKKVDRLVSFAGEPDFALAYSSLVGYFSPTQVARLLGSDAGVQAYRDRMHARLQPVSHLSPLAQAMHLDRTGFLAQNLTVTDKSSMAQSIEVRVPLLSNDMLALADGLAPESLGLESQGKKPLRDYLRQRIPASLVDRKKAPFNPPLDARIRRLGKDRLLDELTRGPIAAVIDGAEVRSIAESHFSGSRNNTYPLWQLLYFSRWLVAAGGR